MGVLYRVFPLWDHLRRCPAYAADRIDGISATAQRWWFLGAPNTATRADDASLDQVHQPDVSHICHCCQRSPRTLVISQARRPHHNQYFRWWLYRNVVAVRSKSAKSSEIHP